MLNIGETRFYREACDEGCSFTAGSALYRAIKSGYDFDDFGVEDLVDNYRTLYTSDGEEVTLTDLAICELLDIAHLDELANYNIEQFEEDDDEDDDEEWEIITQENSLNDSLKY